MTVNSDGMNVDREPYEKLLIPVEHCFWDERNFKGIHQNTKLKFGTG